MAAAPDPAPTLHATATSLGVVVNRTTSPVRTAAAVRVGRPAGGATTTSGRRCATDPTAAVIVARPGVRARSWPSAPTLATRALLVVKAAISGRRSPCLE